jgi:hypothetical protein
MQSTWANDTGDLRKTMNIDDSELFSSAMTDEPIPDVATEAPAVSQERTREPAAETPQQDGPARDDHGRFASRQPVEQQPEPETARDDAANVPSWRLREVREEAERRVAETEARWQRQFAEMQRQNQPKPEPKPAPDLFENPDGFVDHRLQQSLTPIEQKLQAYEARMQAQLEYTSRRDAFKEYGEQAVRTSYDWIAQGIRAQDPDVVHAYNRAMQSEHPYDAIVQAYKRASVMQQIQQVGDLDKWAVQRAQELAAGQQQAPQGGRQPSSGQPQGSITRMPPSLRNVPAARGVGEDDNDTSDAAIFRHAMR